MKKLLFILALWFLLEWVYSTKLKPFIVSEFASPAGRDKVDSIPNVSDTATGVSGNYVYGLDISHYQDREVDWLKTKGGQYQFVICKATEGVTNLDSFFKRNWAVLNEKGINRGAYHFYRCTDDPVAQADWFVKNVGELLPTDLPPVIDFETEDVIMKDGMHRTNCINVDTKETAANMLKFIERVEQLTKRRPVIYVNTSNGNAFFARPEFSLYPLWIATRNVSRLTASNIPATWKGNWSFWQKSQEYDFDNNPGNDLDVFNGDAADLSAFINNAVIKP